ncbi:MAG: hypothetical protein AABY22_03275, partial [Nanoarchaeota archaeon]
MSYEMNMDDEVRPKRLLPEGWKIFTIQRGFEQTSKSGNNMIVFVVAEESTGFDDKIYLVSEPKKRWLLKNLLDACGIKPNKDKENKYVWDILEIEGKWVQGLVVHEPNEYINR